MFHLHIVFIFQYQEDWQLGSVTYCFHGSMYDTEIPAIMKSWHKQHHFSVDMSAKQSADIWPGTRTTMGSGHTCWYGIYNHICLIRYLPVDFSMHALAVPFWHAVLSTCLLAGKTRSGHRFVKKAKSWMKCGWDALANNSAQVDGDFFHRNINLNIIILYCRHSRLVFSCFKAS